MVTRHGQVRDRDAYLVAGFLTAITGALFFDTQTGLLVRRGGHPPRSDYALQVDYGVTARRAA